MIAEHCFGFRLGDEKDEWKLAIDHADVVEGDDEVLFRAQMNGDARAGVAAPPKRSFYAEIAHYLQASRVDDERARLVGAVDQPVDDAGSDPEPVQRRRQHQAGRARTDHQDIHGCIFVHRSRAAWARATILRASTEE